MAAENILIQPSEGNMHDIHRQILHHQRFHLGTALLPLAILLGGGGGPWELVGHNGACGQWENREVLAVADFDHVAIWVMEEELVHYHSPLRHHRRHILYLHPLQLSDHHPHVRTLE